MARFQEKTVFQSARCFIPQLFSSKGTPVRTYFPVCSVPLGKTVTCLFALFLLLAQTRLVRAQSFQVGVAFTPDTMFAMPGDTVNYTAVFTNTTGTDLLITRTGFNSTDGDFFTTDNNFGFFNGNGMGDGSFELMPNQMLTVPDVVSLFLDPGTPVGIFPIDATFLGRDFTDAGNPLVTDQDLGTGTLTVNITPEPGFVTLFAGLGVAGAGFVRKRSRRA